MNEQAIQDAYKLFVEQGYGKSVDDFKKLISTNPDALNDSYNLFKSQGYAKSIDDYSSLMGVGAQSQGELVKKDYKGLMGISADIQVKKKEQPTPLEPQLATPTTPQSPMALPSEDSFLESQKQLPKFETTPLKNDAKKLTRVIDETPKESDYFDGEFGATLRTMDAVAEATGGLTGIGEFIDDIGRAIGGGQKNAAIVSPGNSILVSGPKASSETIRKLIKASNESEGMTPSDEMIKFRKVYEEEGKGVFGFFKGLAESPGAVPELIINSFSTLTNPTTAATVASVIGGSTAVGAAAGGGLPGAVAGFLRSIPYAMGAANVTLETGLTFAELLKQELNKKKLEFTEENVRTILEDEKALGSIRSRSAARGATIGIIDAFTGRLAGRVGAKLLANTTASRIKSALAATSIEMAGGSTGEAAARKLIGQEMDTAEILFEGVAEGPMAAPSLLSEIMKKPEFIVNGQKVTENDVKELIKYTPASELQNIKFDIRNDNVGYKDIIQDKIVTNSIKEEVKQGNPDLNESRLNAITELEKQLKKLEGNTTQTGKDKAAAIRTQIKDIQENQLQEEAVVKTAQTETETAVVTTLTPEQKILRIAQLEDLLNPNTSSLYPIGTKAQLEAELQNLKSEQAADKVVLRTGDPQVGLQEVGEGNVKPKAVITGTQEVAPTQPKQEVAITTLNPTGTIFTEYTPEDRSRLPLGENITTYDVTAGVNPTEKITIYRGVPNNVNEIKSGDFVTTNKQLATDYAGTGKVISMEVNANEILDDKTEPLGEEYILRIPQAEVSSKTQAPKFVRDISALITPATVRGFSPLTERIKKLSLNYDKLIKQYAKRKDSKVLAKIKTAEAQILNDAKQEIIDAVAKVDGVAVQFKDTKRGLWDKKFEPSFNMTLSVSPQADTKKLSDLLFDFAEKYSQDSFILETESELHDEWVDGKINTPLSEKDSNGLANYPQIIYTFAEPVTDEQLSDLSVELENNDISAFNVNNNELQVSVIFTQDQDINLTKDEQYEERKRDYKSRLESTENAVFSVFGSNGNGSLDIRIKKSSYQGATNEGTDDQTRQYDRSDVLKAFQESTTKVEILAVELSDLRQKEINLQKEGKKLSFEDQTRFNDLIKKVQPAVQRTFEANKKLYEDAKIEVEGIAQDAISQVDASISPFPIKRAERASVKAIRWYNSFTEKLGDGSRVNIVVDTDANADKVFKIIDEKYPGDTEVRRITETTDLGYPKRLIEIRTSNGTLAEIQVITNEAYLAKDGIKGFTGDEKQKSTAKQKLDLVRLRLGWNIPDGLGHYFYEIQRDTNVYDNLRDEAARLSDLYYDGFTNPKSKLTESFMNDVEAFKNNVDAADKSEWDVGNNGKAPQSLIDYKPIADEAITKSEVEQFEAMPVSDVKTDRFNKNDALYYDEDERELESGRISTYISSITVQATNTDEDLIGTITKITDEDSIFYFTAQDIDGNDINLDGYDTLGDAKKAIADSYNKIKQKEFNKEAKKQAKVAEKVAEKVAKKEAKKIAATIEDLLALDPQDNTTLKKISNSLDQAIKDINKFEKENLGVNIALPIMKTIIKAIKVLVDAGISLQEAIKRISADNNVNPKDVVDGINAVSQIAPIQKEYDALMSKVNDLIARQKSRNIDNAKIVRNVDTYIRNSEAYDNANDAQKKIMEREGRNKMQAPIRRAVSMGRVLGALKDITNISRQEKLQVIKQIRDLSRNAAQDLATEIRELGKSGKITSNQVANVIARFGKVNMLNEVSVSNFVDYMSKVFANAEYAGKIEQAKSLRRDISKLSKNKDKNANLRDLAQQFAKINQSMVEDIDAYNDMASKIKEATKGSTIRLEKVTFAETVNIENASKYISDTMNAQDEMIRQERIAEIQELMGIDASEFSAEDMLALLESEKPITKYNEGIVREAINKMFNIYSTLINETINQGRDPFTDEEVNLTTAQKDVVKKFMAMDLSLLSPKEALQAVDALANFLQNSSTARMESVLSKYTGNLNAQKIVDKGIVASPLMKYWSESFGRFLAEQTTNLNILFEKMFKGFNRGGMVEDASGVTKLKNNKSMAERESNNIVDKYISQFYKRKANGEAYNTESNSVERGLTAFMMRNVIGTEAEMKAEFNRRKRLIEESIKVLSEGSEKEKTKSELYQKIYDKILKDSKSIQEVKDKTDPTNLEGIEYWNKEWADKYEQLSDVSLNVYNKVLDKDLNYTPDRFVKLESETGNVELDNEESAFHNNNGTIYKKETGVLMTAVKPETLPTNIDNGETNMYIDLSFDKNNANSMYDALVDINTAAPIRQIQAFLNSPNFKKIVPESKDAKLLKERIGLYVRNIRNKNPYSNDELSSAVRKLNKIASIGVGQALGGLLQPVKQMVPVAMNTIINAGGLDVNAIFDSAKNGFINRSGYAISNRGIESQAQVESLNKLIDEASKTTGDKMFKAIEELNRKWLDIFLVKPDVAIARASWITYYEQSLKKKGIDTKGIDYNTHEVNEDAADYAQRMVDRQQNVSDADLAGKLFANKEATNQLFVKMLMPFASFRMNQAARVGADLGTLGNKESTVEDKKIAIKSLGGFAVEMVMFKMIAVGSGILLGTLAKMAMGKDEDDKEFKKRVNNIVKGQATGTFTDLFSPLPIADKLVQMGGNALIGVVQDAMKVPQEKQYNIFRVGKQDAIQGLGLFGIAADRATQLYEISKLASTGKYTDDFGKEKKISEKDQKALGYLIGPALLTNVGLAPVEVNSIIRNSIKDSKKATKTSEEKKQALESAENKLKQKEKKISALEYLKKRSTSQQMYNTIEKKLNEINATGEETDKIEERNNEEKKLKNKLLTDPRTGERYESETKMKRYSPSLYNRNFGVRSAWYRSHKIEEAVDKKVNEVIRHMDDRKHRYRKP